MQKIAYLLTLLFLLTPLTGCLESTDTDEDVSTDTDEDVIGSNDSIDYQDVFVEVSHEENVYQFTIQLNFTAAPLHSDNFQTHVSQGNYDSTIFHRIISGFMIQAGDFENGDGTGGYAANWYGICNTAESELEDCPDQTNWNVPDEADNGLEHLECSVSMAKTGLPNSGGSQFFIVPSDVTTPWLDGVHTVFGKVTEGCENITTISKVSTGSRDKPNSDVIITSTELSDRYTESFFNPDIVEVVEEIIEEVQNPITCADLDLVTYNITTSYPEYEYEAWIYINPVTYTLFIQNSDLVYFENATQVLSNGYVFNLTPYQSPIFDTHTRIEVDSHYSLNTGMRLATINYYIGDTLCIIENPDITLEHDGRGDIRLCETITNRLANGSYEHHHPDCNYVLTENLDKTSTIRGNIEFPSNSVTPEACEFDGIINSFNSSIVSVNRSVAGNWGHFSGGNEFIINYNGDNDSYSKSYFIKADETERYYEYQIRSIGINEYKLCNFAYVELYADENLSEIASLDRNLTEDDTWEVIANDCTFSRNPPIVGESQMGFSHGCSGMYVGLSSRFYEDYPDYVEPEPRESSFDFYSNFTQAIITQDYTMWHSMLSDEVHSINSDLVLNKTNITESYFENFTSNVGIINLENASQLDLTQTHWRLSFYSYSNNLPDSNETFNWTFTASSSDANSQITSPLADSALAQNRIYNDTGWGHGEYFVNSPEYIILSWSPNSYASPIISEYLLTIVVDRNENGDLSIVGITDHNVEIIR